MSDINSSLVIFETCWQQLKQGYGYSQQYMNLCEYFGLEYQKLCLQSKCLKFFIVFLSEIVLLSSFRIILFKFLLEKEEQQFRKMFCHQFFLVSKLFKYIFFMVSKSFSQQLCCIFQIFLSVCLFRLNTYYLTLTAS